MNPINFSPGLFAEAREKAKGVNNDTPFVELPVGEYGRLYVVENQDILSTIFTSFEEEGKTYFIGSLKT